MAHLAQLNIARMRAPLEDPQMAGFVELLEPINALADVAPGFVWRLQTDDGDATSIRAFDDPLMLVNLSVWESVEALRAFTYKTEHREPLRARGSWFETMKDAHLVLWWVPEGHQPSLEEAKSKLDLLRSNGPSAEAFTLARPFAQ